MMIIIFFTIEDVAPTFRLCCSLPARSCRVKAELLVTRAGNTCRALAQLMLRVLYETRRSAFSREALVTLGLDLCPSFSLTASRPIPSRNPTALTSPNKQRVADPREACGRRLIVSDNRPGGRSASRNRPD